MNTAPAPTRSGGPAVLLLGLLLLAAAALLDAAAVGALAAPDGHIEGDLKLAAILVVRALLALAGLACLLPGARLRLPPALRGVGLLLAAGLVVVGAIGRMRAGPPDLHQVLRRMAAEDPYIGTNNIAADEASLRAEEARPDNAPRVAEAHERLADTLLRHGRNADSVAHLEQALAITAEAGLPSERVLRIRRALGVALMRTGEASHCIAMHNPESCLFPVEEGGVWSDPSGAVRAAEQFLLILRERPQDQDVRWLLNVAHMVAGTHPAGVPAEFLIERSIFEPAPDSPDRGALGRFRDVAGAVGVDNFSLAGGAIMEDFDGDGLLDLFSTTMDAAGQARFFRNRGDGTFEDRTEAAGLVGQLGGLNCSHADVDGDGDPEVLILRGGWQGDPYGLQRNSLLRFEADGTFTDVTEQAGLAEVVYPTQVGVWADYDLDGDVDLYVGNEFHPAQLFRNDGHGRFADVATEAGVRGPPRRIVKGAAWGDYDNDGDPDLYVSNYGKPNLMFRNEGDGTFVEVGEELGVRATDDELSVLPGDELADRDPIVAVRGKDLTLRGATDLTFATWFWDMDNDGWLDLYVGGYGASLAEVAGSYLGTPVPLRRHLRMYRNDGRGGFVDASHELGVDQVHVPMGANYGDVDNDGYPDAYLGTGKPPFEFLVPNVLLRNVAGRRFADVTALAGVGHLQKGHGVAFGDLDNDGDLDLFAQMGGLYPGDKFRDALFENPGNDHHWLTLHLVGVRANRHGVGARIRVDVRTPSGERSIHALGGTGGSFGSSSLRQEIGLGDALEVLRLEIRWPGAGSPQVFEDVPLDAFVEATEGSVELRRLELQRVDLAG